MIPDVYENEELYAHLLVGTAKSPGIVEIFDHDRDKGWDIKPAKGSTGASTVRNDDPPGAFGAHFDLYEPDDFGRWPAFQFLLETMVDGPKPAALAIYHPLLALNRSPRSRSKGSAVWCDSRTVARASPSVSWSTSRRSRSPRRRRRPRSARARRRFLNLIRLRKRKRSYPVWLRRRGSDHWRHRRDGVRRRDACRRPPAVADSGTVPRREPLPTEAIRDLLGIVRALYGAAVASDMDRRHLEELPCDRR